MYNGEQDSKILITGGLGAIGTVLSKTLYGAGRNILVYDCNRNSNAYRSIPGFEVIHGDIRDSEKLLQIFKNEKISGIVHLAAISKVDVAEEDNSSCASVNTGGTYNLMAVIEKSGKKPWIINCSSREVYGNPEYLPVPESHILNPVNNYGKSKVAAEGIVKYYTKAIGLNAITVRPSNIYGSPYDLSGRMIPSFIDNALTGKTLEIYGGEQTLDLLYISDAIEGLTRAILHLEPMTGEGYYDEFNLTTGTPHAIREVIDLISHQIGSNVETVNLKPRSFDVQHYAGDPCKAKETLGFMAKVPLAAGIVSTVDLYRKIWSFRGTKKMHNTENVIEPFRCEWVVT